MIAADPDQKDVEAPLKLLNESSGALKIQDVLAYFPEFTKIEHFKEPIIECLKEQSGRIKVCYRRESLKTM